MAGHLICKDGWKVCRFGQPGMRYCSDRSDSSSVLFVRFTGAFVSNASKRYSNYVDFLAVPFSCVRLA